MTLTVGSLFSGVGGMDLGLERAGFVIRFQVEIDEWCRRVLAKHWPDVPRYGDITRITGAELERVDLLAAGFPCQPVSSAGRRLAQADDRWLWPEVIRLVRHLRPRYVLLENVPGLLRRGFGDVLGDLAASGFDAEWQVVSAASVGAPHLRERVFVVAYAAGTRLEGPGVFRSAPDRAGWHPEPDVCRVVDGVPVPVDRLRGLGNAVVPAVAQYVGECILKAVA